MATSKKSDKEPVRKLTAHDLAFGIGRKFTNEEIALFIKEHENDTFIDGDLMIETYKKKITQNKRTIIKRPKRTLRLFIK
jgi:hypothetical protein